MWNKSLWGIYTWPFMHKYEFCNMWSRPGYSKKMIIIFYYWWNAYDYKQADSDWKEDSYVVENAGTSAWADL